MRKVNMTSDGHDEIVSASDLEKYGYCPLSWWLSEQDAVENEEDLKKGGQDHALISKDVKRIKTKEKLGEESERGVLWFSLIAIVIGINGVAIIYQIYAPSSQGKAIMMLLSLIAVLWLIVAALFFYSGIKREMKMRHLRRASIDHDGIPGKLRNGRGLSASRRNIDWKKRFWEAKWTTLAFFMVSSVLTMHGLVILFSLERIQFQILSSIFLILSLVWLIGSSFFYYTLLSDLAHLSV